MKKYLITKFETYGREPIISKMSDGSLVCTFLTGDKTEPMNGNVIEIARSFDDGESWTGREILFQHPTRGMWCTDIFCEGELPLMAVHLYNESTYYRELQTMVSTTHDSGKTWSLPVSLSGAVNGCSLRQGIKLSNGDYLYPLYWQEVCGSFDCDGENCVYPYSDWIFRGGVGISQDKGKTWQRYGYFADEISLWEPNAVETEPGHILIYFRNHTRYLMMSESFDYGRTWSELKQTDIPNADTKFILKKIGNKVLLINNMTSKGSGFSARTNLSMCLSENGKDFKNVIALSGDDEPFFYPHAYADDDNKLLYVAYENTKEHYLVKLKYEELGI